MRRVALLLLACALLLKLPAGFMPEANARGIAFGWCNAVSAEAAAEGKALLEKALGERPDKHKPAAEQPCSFAAAAQPFTTADPLPQLILPVYQAPQPQPRLTAAPGRGMVAPPPHATGPPPLA